MGIRIFQDQESHENGQSLLLGSQRKRDRSSHSLAFLPFPSFDQLTLSLPINEYTDELTKERIEDLLGLVVAFPVALRSVFVS